MCAVDLFHWHVLCRAQVTVQDSPVNTVRDTVLRFISSPAFLVISGLLTAGSWFLTVPISFCQFSGYCQVLAVKFFLTCLVPD